MSDLHTWIGKLQAEIARELGQPVTLAAGKEAPAADAGYADAVEVPGARLLLGADPGDVQGFLIEARVIEAGQADAEMVRELWSGILSSAAAGLGGKASPTQAASGPGEAWVLQLGEARVRLSLVLEAVEGTSSSAPPREETRSAPPAAPPPVAGVQHTGGNFDLLLEVELDASVRFGSREMELKELLELGPGDVVELDRQVADAVDLIVGDRIVARGEVVLVNGNFGLRVTEVAEPVRRLESIRCLW